MHPTWLSQELLYVACWDKHCEILHRSLIRAPVGTNSDRDASSLLSRIGQKKQEQWEEAVNSFDSRTPATRCGAPSVNVLAGLDTSLACAPSQQTPSSHNSWRTGDTRPAAANPPGSSTSGCPICGRSQHLRKTVFGPFRPEELAVTLRSLKPGRSPGLDSIFPEFIPHTGWALKSWRPTTQHHPVFAYMCRSASALICNSQQNYPLAMQLKVPKSGYANPQISMNRGLKRLKFMVLYPGSKNTISGGCVEA